MDTWDLVLFDCLIQSYVPCRIRTNRISYNKREINDVKWNFVAICLLFIFRFFVLLISLAPCVVYNNFKLFSNLLMQINSAELRLNG